MDAIWQAKFFLGIIISPLSCRYLVEKVVPGNRVTVVGIYSIRKGGGKAKVLTGTCSGCHAVFVVSEAWKPELWLKSVLLHNQYMADLPDDHLEYWS